MEGLRPHGARGPPHKSTTDVNTNHLFSSWEQCLGHAEGQDYPLAALPRIHAERAPEAALCQLTNGPPCTGLWGKFSILQSTKTQRTAKLANWAKGGSSTSPFWGLWPWPPHGPDPAAAQLPPSPSRTDCDDHSK